MPSLISWLPFGLAVGYFAFNLIFVSFRGNFPLNDDPLYAIAVRDFLNTGQLQIPISMASCFLPEISGAAFCSLLGYSHEMLRLHTLIYSLLGIIAFFLVMREAGMHRASSGLMALLYSVNPIYVNLSYSFMTDVYSLTMVNFYCFFLLKGIRRSSPQNLLLAAVFLGLSFFVRQTNALFIVVNFIVLLSIYWKEKRTNFSQIGFLIVLPIAMFLGANYLMTSAVTQASDFSRFYIDQLLFRLGSFITAPHVAISNSVYELSKVLLYFGLFLSPCLICFAPGLLKKSKWTALSLVSLIVSVLLAGIVLFRAFLDPNAGTLIPYNANIWWLWTLGPASMLGYSTVPYSPEVRWTVTIVASLLGLVLTLVLFDYFSVFVALSRKVLKGIAARRFSKYLFFSCAFLGMLSFLLIQVQVMPMDRYYLQLYLPIALLLAVSFRWFRAKTYLAFSLIFALAIGAYTSACQSHYMSWNRARWQAIEYAIASGVEPSQIDGGAEYYYLDEIKVVAKVDYENHQQLSMPEGARGRPPLDKLRYWSVRGDDYVVSHQAFEGHEVVKAFPYWSNLLGKESKVYLLKRKEGY